MLLLERTTKNWDQFTREWMKNRVGLEEKNIHDLRVAGRRLMASLRLVESGCKFGPKRSMRRLIKHIVKRLGPLRDLQVHLEILDDSTRQSGLAAFRKYLNIEEKRECRLLRRYLTTERMRKLQPRMKKALRRASQRLRKVSTATLRSRIRTSIRSHRAGLQKARRHMTESDPRSLHAVRISAKTLRYLLEAAEPVLGRASRAELRRLRLEQNKLGRMHDLHVARNRYAHWTKQFHP